MTVPQILAQVVAIVIIILMAIGAQSKTQKMFLFFQLVANALYGVHYGLLSKMTAVVISGICVVRTLIFFLYNRENKKVPIWLLITIFAVVIGAGVVTWENWLSIIPILATIVFTYGQWQRDVRVTKKTVITGDFGWIVYNAFCSGYMDIAGKIVEITSCAIALRRDKSVEE